MNKKLIVQRVIQFVIMLFLLFSICFAWITKEVSVTSFVLACVLGVCQAILIILLLYTEED